MPFAKKIRILLMFIVPFSFYQMLSCGGGNVNLSAPENTPTDLLPSLDSTENGETDDIPNVSSSSTSVMILSCEDVATNGTASANNVSLTCEVLDEILTMVYFCESGVLIKNDDGIETELFEFVTVTCSGDDEDMPVISEEELVIS